MTEERKQELRQLLAQAMGSLVIRYDYGGAVSIPIDLYKRYLQERWKYYGLNFLSFSSLIGLTLDVVSETTKSNLLGYIRKELAPFINEGTDPDLDCIRTSNYLIECNSTHGDRLYSHGGGSLRLFVVMERLLEITLVRGVKEAVSFFDRCSRPKGTHAFFRDVGLLEGVKLETEVEVFEGVRLVPLPSSRISAELEQLLFRFPVHGLTDQVSSIFGKTLLAIDRPGFSMLCKPSKKAIQSETRIDDLPFQVEVHKVKFPNVTAVDSFQTLFCQALSLVCDSPVKILIGFYALEEDKSFDLPHGGGGMHRQDSPLGTSTEAKEADIEKAKCLYERLVDLDSNDREKLQIPIDRWVESKTNRNRIDKIIDLGIAFEALYLSDIDEPTELSFRLRLRAAWHLGENEKHRRVLMKEFSEIYAWRSKVVHTGKLPNKKKKPPFTHEEVKQFIENAQDLCRESIMRILEDGKFPDWNSLILGDEAEGDIGALGENLDSKIEGTTENKARDIGLREPQPDNHTDEPEFRP